MPEYLELESGGTFLEFEDGELLELELGAVFVAGNTRTFAATTQPLGWTGAEVGSFAAGQESRVLGKDSSSRTWSADQKKSWH